MILNVSHHWIYCFLSFRIIQKLRRSSPSPKVILESEWPTFMTWSKARSRSVRVAMKWIQKCWINKMKKMEKARIRRYWFIHGIRLFSHLKSAMINMKIWMHRWWTFHWRFHGNSRKFFSGKYRQYRHSSVHWSGFKLIKLIHHQFQ